MIEFIKKYSDIWILVLITIFTMLPLLQPGFFPMHDDEQVGRLYQLDKDVKTGHLPPRLAQDLGFGFDYPLFNFYPSFVYYVAEIFHLLGFSYIASIKLMIAAGFLLSGIFMYLFSKEYIGKIGGIVAAVAYTYAPYHATDVYVRGALPEFWSFVFIPALFWSFYHLAKEKTFRYLVSSAIFVAFLVLTHNPIAMMSSIFLGAYFLYLIFQTKEKKKLIGKILLSVSLGLGISAYFWIPSYFEKHYTMVNLLTNELADYHLHFVYLRQFLFSTWGYGGSLYGLYDGMSFQIGQAQALLGAISILFSFFFLWERRKISGIFLMFLFLFFFSLFIQTKYSEIIWDSIQQLSYIQFPWRFLLFTAFTLAFLIGYLFVFIKKEKIKISLAAVMIFILLVMNVQYFAPEKYLPTAKDEDYTADEVIRWRTSIMAFEYTPAGIATKKSEVGNTVIAITQKEIPTRSYEVIRGKMSVMPVQDVPQQKVFALNVVQPGVLQINTFTFPGWKTYIDGQEVPYSDTNKFKLITVPVATGKHTVRATFTDTPLRMGANSISIATILGILGYGLLKKKRYDKN